MTEVPKGWALLTIGQVAAVNPPLGVDLAPDEVVSFIPMAAVEVETGRLDPNETKPFGELRRKSYRHFAEGDVLFAKITPCMENGKIAVAGGLTGGRGFGSTEFHVLRTYPGVNPRFLLHYLLQHEFRKDAARNTRDTKIWIGTDPVVTHPQASGTATTQKWNYQIQMSCHCSLTLGVGHRSKHWRRASSIVHTVRRPL